MGDARFLVVDDDADVGRGLARLIRRHGEPVVAATAHEAERLLEDGGWCGLIVDIMLPDGSGLDVLERARRSYPLISALVLSGRTDADKINRAYDLQAAYVVKPFAADRLGRFVKEAVSRQPAGSLAARIERITCAHASAWGLTEAEVEVLTRSALGESRDEIAAARESSEETVRTHIARMLAKTGYGSLSAAVGWVLREAARVSR